MTPEQIALLKLILSMKDDAAGTTPGIQLHGNGGLLATPGMNRQIVNGMILPRGLAGRLRVRPAVTTNEVVGVLTGLTANTGAQNTGACDPAPVAGQFKMCHQTLPFGRQSLESQVLQIDRVGEIVNRGEFRDNVLVGAPQADNLLQNVNWNTALQREVEKKMAELYLAFFRTYGKYVYTGNPASTAGNTGFQQYRGLDLQINNDKIDAITGERCPAADSFIFDFNGAGAQADGPDVYAVFANAFTNMKRLANQLGMGNVEWALSMRYGAFWALSAMWPCVYQTSNCSVSGLTIGGAEQIQMRDQMRAGEYLLIEGERVPVIIDDFITETVPGAVGTYESDVYLVPLRAGGTDLTYFEYFDLNAEAIQAANRMAPTGAFEAIDGGRFLLHRKNPTNECVQVRITERPRLVLAAPHLAARFTNLRYNITIHERDALPGEPYFVNGGSTGTPLQNFYGD